MGQLDLLWDYQAVETEYKQFETTLKSTPERKQFMRVRNFLIQQQNALKKLEEDVIAKQQRIAELHMQFEAVEKANEAGSKALEALDEDDIKAVEIQRKAFETVQATLIRMRKELTELIAELERSDVQLREMLGKISQAKKEYTELKEINTKELEKVAPELERFKEKVAQAAQKVEPSLLKRYKSIKKNRANPVAKIEDEKCSGCNMALPSLMVSKIKEADKRIYECENCGRILYYMA